MAYADYMFYFEDERPRRNRPYSQKSLRKFARRHAYELECHKLWEAHYDTWNPSEPAKTYSARVENFIELTTKWRSYGFDSYWYPYDYYVEWYTIRLKSFPPCPLPD